MGILPIGILLNAEANRIHERQERIAIMVANFSAMGVSNADPQLAAAVAQHARAWVAGQLGKPETATFHDEIARLCPNRTVLLLGRVEALNVTGRPCSNWFIVEFDLVSQEGSGAMLDAKPPYLLQPPPIAVMSGDQLPYQPATMAPTPEGPKPTSWLLNGMLIVSITVAIILIILAIRVS